ncbi:MAG: FIST signal transduction protein [Microcoleaceae cyanobacterium]
MLKSTVGHSNDPDSRAAIAEILEQCVCDLAGVPPKAGILLAASSFDHALILHRICEVFPDIDLIGGTTDGEMSSVLGFEQDSLMLMLFCSDTITFSAGIGNDVSKDVIAATQSAVQQASVAHQEPIKFCITLPESLTTSGVLILDSLRQALGQHIPIFGGLTADPRQTYQFFRTEVYNDAVPILLFSGPVLFSHGIASGWHPLGKPGTVTKAEKNIVYEIDGQPALEFYHRYLGTVPPSLEYPLAVFDADSDSRYMRAPSGLYDPTVGSITFFGDIPVQSVVQITETTYDEILSASKLSTEQALENYPGQAPAAALLFSCVARRQILGSRACEEYELIQSCLTQNLPCFGFYSNGEIAPLEQQGLTHFHNETFITLLLGEE